MPSPAGSRRRPRSHAARGVVASGLAGVWLLAGCGDAAVDVGTSDLPAADRAACAALLDALPDALNDEPPREVDPPQAPGAAYGDPAIVVRCGVDVPEQFDRFSQCQEVDGVGWFVADEDLSDEPTEVTTTAVGYRPRVSVTVPAAYWPMGAGTVMAQLVEPVSTSLELVDDCA